jgi:uncharacterized protein DUF4280
MPPLVTAGTTMTCTMGAAPATLVVPTPVVSATTPVATIADTVPTTNIPTFGMCMSPGNPQVAAATTAADGVLTPQPCVPATGAPWTPGSVSAQIGGIPCVLMTSTCQCMWGGTITVVAPEQQLDMGT